VYNGFLSNKTYCSKPVLEGLAIVSQTAPAPALIEPVPGLFASIVEATKPRITRLVGITSAVGFGAAALGRSWQAEGLVVAAIGCITGTVLSAAGANALNQWMERERDALMVRTCTRPLPQKRLEPRTVLAAGLGLGAAGVGILWALCGAVPAAVSLATILIYVLLYTPLKPVTPWATLVGAVPGALPPLIGYTAGAVDQAGSLGTPGAWVLFAIMFIWQMPHFLAIAWMYKDDYALGGYRVLPVIDPTGRKTARSILLWSLALVPVSVAPVILMKTIPAGVYGVLAAAMGVGFLLLSVKLAGTLARTDARRMFIASIIHLPLLLVLMVVCCAVSALI
jgi:heme o synthase